MCVEVHHPDSTIHEQFVWCDIAEIRNRAKIGVKFYSDKIDAMWRNAAHGQVRVSSEKSTVNAAINQRLSAI